MNLKTLKDIDVSGKNVLYRAPYDIEVIGGKLEDTKRIDATIPTLKYLIEKKCKIAILTYVGRPDGKVIEELRTNVHAKYLEKVLGQKVKKIDDCIGNKVQDEIKNLEQGQVLMLENVRFYKEETEDNDEFAKKLTIGFDLVVFDGFPQAHRVHASTTGILRHLQGVAGLYFEKEVSQLEQIVGQVKRPFISIVGGAKVSDKVSAIKRLSQISDVILTGGGVANAFLNYSGINVSDSYLEDIYVDKAKATKKDINEVIKDILSDAKPLNVVIPHDTLSLEGTNILMPVDFVVEKNDQVQVIDRVDVVDLEGFMIKDIGPQTVEYYQKLLVSSATIFWNGPVGVFEDTKFLGGSKSLLETAKSIDGISLMAGGDTIYMIEKLDDMANFPNYSLAGGATLDYIAGEKLPVIEILKK